MVSPTCSASVLRSSSSLSCIVLTSVSWAPALGRPCSLVSGLARRPAPVVRVSVLLLGIRGVICVPDLSGTRWVLICGLGGAVWSGDRPGDSPEKHEGRGPGDVGFAAWR